MDFVVNNKQVFIPLTFAVEFARNGINSSKDHSEETQDKIGCGFFSQDVSIQSSSKSTYLIDVFYLTVKSTSPMRKIRLGSVQEAENVISLLWPRIALFLE